MRICGNDAANRPVGGRTGESCRVRNRRPAGGLDLNGAKAVYPNDTSAAQGERER